MATKRSSFFLAVLFIANPFMLLFYQNCSVVPKSNEETAKLYKATKSPASESRVQNFDRTKN